jgi:hypothetical protein
VNGPSATAHFSDDDGHFQFELLDAQRSRSVLDVGLDPTLGDIPSPAPS